VWHERIDAVGGRAGRTQGLPELAPAARVALAVDGATAHVLVTPEERTADPLTTLEEGDSYVVPLRVVRFTPDEPPALVRSEFPERIPSACLGFNPSAPRPLDAEPHLAMTGDGLLRAAVVARHDGCGDHDLFGTDPNTGGRAPRRLFHGVIDVDGPGVTRLAELPLDDAHEVARLELQPDRATIVRRDHHCELCASESDNCGTLCGYVESVVVTPLEDDGPALDLGAVSFSPQPFAFDINDVTRVGLVRDDVTTELRWSESDLVEVRTSEAAPFYLDAQRPFERAPGAPLVVGTGLTLAECICPPDVDCDCTDTADAAQLPAPVAAVATFGCLLDTGIDVTPCSGDLDCSPDEYCEQDDVCLPPPECEEGGCEPVCYGACTPR
jgi:hypothetical protein